MQAIWKDQVIAEASKEDLIYIEGNWYFPPNSLNRELITDSQTHTTCPWKGEANYYNVVIDNETNSDAVWYYPEPKSTAIDQVKKDFTNYLAFWRGVEVKES